MDYSILETLIRRAERNPDDMELFRWVFMRSSVLVLGKVPGPPAARPGKRTLNKGQELELCFFEAEDGRHVLPVFTSVERLRESLGAEADSLELKAGLLLRMLEDGVEITLNPNTDCSHEFSRPEIMGLLRGKLGRFKINGRVLLGPLQAAPWLVLRGFKEYFHTCPWVEAAYASERMEEEDGRPVKALEIGVVMEGGQEEYFLSDLVPECQVLAGRFPEVRLAFCLVTGKVRQEYAALRVRPFYVKGFPRRVRKVRMYIPKQFGEKGAKSEER